MSEGSDSKGSGRDGRQQFWESRVDLDFMGVRRFAVALSVLLLAVSIGSLFLRGLNFGLDFTGGTLVELEFPGPADPQEVRVELEQAGFQNIVVQNFGTPQDIVVRVPPQAAELAIADADEARQERASIGDRVRSTLQERFGEELVMRRSEFVGPAVGEELREQGGLAMLAALALVMVYIMLRFTGKFAVGAVVALAHDVVIVLGAFSVAQWTFDLPSLAAVLAVIGYSLNDTIVVSDRIRENFRRLRKGGPLEVINVSLNQTLGRTLVTSLTTLLVLIALLVFGGVLIEGFAEALVVGVVIGTYSSIYVAANVLVGMGISRDDLALPVKEGEDQEALI